MTSEIAHNDRCSQVCSHPLEHHPRRVKPTAAGCGSTGGGDDAHPYFGGNEAVGIVCIVSEIELDTAGPQAGVRQPLRGSYLYAR